MQVGLGLGCTKGMTWEGRGIHPAIGLYADVLATIPRRIDEEVGILAEFNSLDGLRSLMKVVGLQKPLATRKSG